MNIYTLHLLGKYKDKGISKLKKILFPLFIFSLGEVGFIFFLLLLPYSLAKRNISTGFGDSGFYIWISQHGYILNRCIAPPHTIPPWCGNAAWLPLYPYVIKVLSVFGHPGVVAIIVSQLFTLATIILIWKIIKNYRNKYLAMCLLLVFPGIVFLYQIYPVSMMLFLSLLLMKWLVEGRYKLAIIPAFLIPLSYDPGVAIIGVTVVWAAYLYIKKGKWMPVTYSVIASILGYITFLSILQISVGNWRGQLLINRNYGTGIHIPFYTLFINTAPHPGAYFTKANTSALLSAAVLAMIICLAIVIYNRWGELTKLDKIIAVYTFVYFFTPLVTGPGATPYRAESLLIPSVILFRYLPRWLLVIIILILIPLYYMLTSQVTSGAMI